MYNLLTFQLIFTRCTLTIKCTSGDLMTVRETKAHEGGGRNLRPAAVHVQNLHNELPSFSDKPPAEDFIACSIYSLFLKSKPSEQRVPHKVTARHHEVFSGLTGGGACLSLLPGLSQRFLCGFTKVLNDNFLPAQPPNATLNHSEDLL